MGRLLTPLLLAAALAGCRSETARPVPVEGAQHQPTISSGTADEQLPPTDAATDEEQMSPEEARKTVHQAVIKNTGVQNILGVKEAREEVADVFSRQKALTEEETKALQEALGTLEEKPPPPLKKP